MSLLSGLCFAAPAHAFCISRTCDPDENPKSDRYCPADPDTGCATDGLELFRQSSCYTFGIAAGTGEILGVDDDVFEEIVQRAYDRWANVDCGDGPPSFSASSVGAVDATMSFTCQEPGAHELNLDTWLFGELLEKLPSGKERCDDSRRAALAAPNFVTSTGEVVDADVTLNQCLLDTMPQEDIEAILLTVATHEAGHVLGLAHSTDRDALMFKAYNISTARELTPDDIDGICTLFPPSSEEQMCPVAGYAEAALDQEACEMASQDISKEDDGSGCSLAGHSSGQTGAGWLLPGFALLLSRRRRNR